MSRRRKSPRHLFVLTQACQGLRLLRQSCYGLKMPLAVRSRSGRAAHAQTLSASGAFRSGALLALPGSGCSVPPALSTQTLSSCWADFNCRGTNEFASRLLYLM